MKLKELKENNINDHDEVKQWFEDNMYGGVEIYVQNDLSVNLYPTNNIFAFMDSAATEIPYQINDVLMGRQRTRLASFCLRDNSKLKSVKNLPLRCVEIDLAGSALETLEGFNSDCAVLRVEWTQIDNIQKIFPFLTCTLDALFFGNNRIESLVGIHEMTKHEIGELHLIYMGIKEGGLGMLLIPGLRLIHVDPSTKEDCREPLEIIAKYAGRPEDIYKCQAELIDKGYEEFAKL